MLWRTRLRNRLRRQFDFARKQVQVACARVHPAPVFILGHQKSGTTAIAALLGKHAGIPVTLDLANECRGSLSYRLVLNGQMSFETYLRRNKLDFSRPIIKDPNLTFLYKHLESHFPESTCVFIVRHPHDMIRSILDRHHLPGDLAELDKDSYASMGPGWIDVFTGSGGPGMNYVERLAHRWVEASHVYFANADKIVLVRYEDFCANKAQAIQELAGRLGLPSRFDIAEFLDVQYQPRGPNRSVNLETFFGPNGDKIDRVCREFKGRFGYEI